MENPKEKEQLQSDLLTKLNDYCEGLFYEIGGLPEGKANLIITAEGDVKLFKDVEKLIGKAPKLDKWEFIAFKPPMGTDFKINYEGLELDPNNLWFLPLKNTEEPDSIGLRVGFQNFNSDKEKLYISAIYIILDSVLGERSNAEDMGYIEVGLLPDQPADKGYIELVKLPAFIAWKKEEISNSAGVNE